MTISNMGGAIEHWLGFQDKIGRSFMMNEDAIKYPLADYLVNHGNIDLKFIDLERPHPNFSNRLTDVSVIDSVTRNLENIFELKLASSATRKQSEKQRIFNDLMRLHLANLSTGGKCYFIITGKSTNFQRDFQNFPNQGSRFYKKWFSFEKGKSLKFNLSTETDPNYLSIYKKFILDYSGTYQGARTTSLQLPSKITTTCEFITGFKATLVPYMTGIWSVA